LQVSAQSVLVNSPGWFASDGPTVLHDFILSVVVAVSALYGATHIKFLFCGFWVGIVGFAIVWIGIVGVCIVGVVLGGSAPGSTSNSVFSGNTYFDTNKKI